ncbi:GNAT family N-acetyltransferase [Shewanella cyperi]|uniref:GNAT family N-acetyltransferase n=1 Tax=Shewanella cyperi TaxID=2814292 RepID=A0A975AJ83_9GAMM|nr:GNAT family N-acetyltransferase [Shewanella cyperi]QSX29022.1 GNAT family N-acetyltransferase [Shewanella cyperi]
MPVPQPAIMPLTPAMLPQLAEIYHAAVQQSMHPSYSAMHKHIWSPRVRDRRHWRARLRGYQVFVCCERDAVLGFIACQTRFPQRGELDYLYVAPEAQGRGIARALVQHLLAWATEQHWSELSTQASYHSRPLFAALGFEYQGRCYQRRAGLVFESFNFSLTLPTQKTLPAQKALTTQK